MLFLCESVFVLGNVVLYLGMQIWFMTSNYGELLIDRPPPILGHDVNRISSWSDLFMMK